MKEAQYHHGNLRNELIEAGIELMNDLGPKKFSLRKVAAKCNVSHAAPYSHFSDIEDLTAAMGEHVTSQFTKKLREAIRGKENGNASVGLLGQAYIDFFIEHPQYFLFLFHYSGTTIDLDSESPEDYPPFVLFRNTAYAMFREKELPEDQFKEQLIMLWAMVHGIVSLLTTEGIRYSGDWSKIFSSMIAQEA
jgi:AcrR family transcriptional regulator